MSELVNSVIKNEYEYLNWYNNIEPSDRDYATISRRAAILGEAVRLTGVDNYGEITRKQIFEVLYQNIAVEYEILTTPGIRWSKESLDKKVQSVASLYQSALSLEPEMEQKTRLEELVKKILGTMQGKKV
jgi:hypothetical protein